MTSCLKPFHVLRSCDFVNHLDLFARVWRKIVDGPLNQASDFRRIGIIYPSSLYPVSQLEFILQCQLAQVFGVFEGNPESLIRWRRYRVAYQHTGNSKGTRIFDRDKVGDGRNGLLSKRNVFEIRFLRGVPEGSNNRGIFTKRLDDGSFYWNRLIADRLIIALGKLFSRTYGDACRIHKAIIKVCNQGSRRQVMSRCVFNFALGCVRLLV